MLQGGLAVGLAVDEFQRRPPALIDRDEQAAHTEDIRKMSTSVEKLKLTENRQFFVCRKYTKIVDIGRIEDGQNDTGD
jgi:hypothetical protein